MSTTVTPFQKFVALISFDQENNQIRKQLQDLTSDINNLKQALTNAEHELLVAHDLVKIAQKAVDATELTNQELDATEKTKKNQLDQVQDKKEYAALKKEITYLKEQQHNNELILVQAWTKLETAKQTFEKQKEALNHKIVDIQANINTKQAQILALTQQINNYELERKAKEIGVEVHLPSSAELATFQTATRRSYAKWKAQINPTLVSAIEQIVESSRKA